MKHDLSCRMDMLRTGDEVAYMVTVEKAAVPKAILELLRLLFGKRSRVRWRGDGMELDWRFVNGNLEVHLDGGVYLLDDRRRDLLLSALLDMTEAYPTYDHLDLDLDDRVELTLFIRTG